MIKSLLLLILASLAAFFIAGCKHSEHTHPVVTLSIEPQKWLLERIGGDRIEVRTFLAGDANPESFDPALSVIRDAARSDAFMRMGHLPWENSLIEKVVAGNESLLVVDTSEGIDLIEGSHGHHHHPGMSEVDPHTWSSVKNARIMAANMLKGLQTIDPAGSDYYEKNYRALDASLDSLDKSFASRLAPLKGESFLVWHPSLSYFARDYGLNQIAMGMENKEMTLPMMQKKLDEAASHRAKVFFIQPQMDAGGKAEPIIARTGAVKQVIHPLSPEWQAELEVIVDALLNTSSDNVIADGK